MCKCIDLTHDEVRGFILSKELKSLPAVMQELGWKTSCGCPSCRPALNYYLLCAWPGEYRDDAQSRFINERVHANIQKDGTFSVVPRMWGGLTTPDELRAIADVADRFKIPTVKVTGGQRIDLLGVRRRTCRPCGRSSAPPGMVSGQAYAKGLRTVKTCVGSEWCRFGTQDSTGLGVKLEHYLCGSWTPAKVKLAVSGCPRNCAEATVKDIGIICVESGYDIHIAGAAGLHVRADRSARPCRHRGGGDRVCRRGAAALSRDRRPISSACTSGSSELGLETIRAAIMDDHEGRRALVERFQKSQRAVRKDPWAERAAGRELHEFMPLAVLTPIVAGRRRMSEAMKQSNDFWFDVGPLHAIPPARRAHREDAAPRDRDLPHRRATRSSRWRTAARTRAGR